MTWFRGGFHGAEFEIKSNGSVPEENNLLAKVGQTFFPALVRGIRRLPSRRSPVSAGSPIVWGASGRAGESMTSRAIKAAEGWWWLDTRRRYPRPSSFTSDTRGWEFGGGSYRALEGCRRSLPTATRDKEREGRCGASARARAQARARTHVLRTHACTHAGSHPSRENGGRTPDAGTGGTRKEREWCREQEYETQLRDVHASTSGWIKRIGKLQRNGYRKVIGG